MAWSRYPVDVTFVEPVGTPLGITFMEYESRFGNSSYLVIENLKDTARLAHPELGTGERSQPSPRSADRNARLPN